MRYLSDIPREEWGYNETRLHELYEEYSVPFDNYWRLLDEGYFGSTKHKKSPMAWETWRKIQGRLRRLEEFSKLVGISPWEKPEDWYK